MSLKSKPDQIGYVFGEILFALGISALPRRRMTIQIGTRR
jgi:hypothetical protein